MTKGRMSKRVTTLAGAVALALVALGGTALAGHVGADVKSYTGCLSTSGGTLTQINEGNAPLGGACGRNQVEAHFSGGDITSIAAQSGGGLTVSHGTNGGVSLSLRRDCTSGQVVKWNGTAWVCSSDSDSSYTAGTGLDLTGTTFSMEPAYRVQNTPDCASGSFATGFDGNGEIQCDAPAAATGPPAYSGSSGAVQVAGQMTIISKTLPAGSYVATAHIATYAPGSTDGEAFGQCDLSGDHADFQFAEHGNSDTQHATLTSAISHPGGALLLTCTEEGGNFDIRSASLTAIKVGSLG